MVPEDGLVGLVAVKANSANNLANGRKEMKDPRSDEQIPLLSSADFRSMKLTEYEFKCY